MMEAFRKHMKKVMWGIAMMFVAGIFFWYGSGKQSQNTVAQVGKIKIKADEYRKRISQQLRIQRDNQSKDLDDNQINAIKKQTLSSLINQEMLYSEALRLGIVTTDEEIINTVQSLPQFQQDEKFDYRLYLQTLRFSMDMNADEFEKMIGKTIAIRKLERTILSSVKVTQPELQIYYINRNNTLEGFKEKIDEVRNEVMQQKRMAIYQSWMRNLQQNSKITVNPQLADIN
ncbi:MAG: SurA N-terminal domain-containing protein [Elusimicrobia bacterium]|nr:SurA N-terminal domain-containing protein [Elusimicrobiota bacterium]